MLQSAHEMYMLLAAEITTKLGFLSEPPYLFSNVTTPGVAAECLQKFDEIPEHLHQSGIPTAGSRD